MTRLRYALVALAVLAGACAIGRKTTARGFDQRWDELSHAQRMELMGSVVLPEMKARFQAFDPERFAEFDCATCHGAGAHDGSYAMPNPELPHLRSKGLFREHRRADPDIVRFMWKEVEVPMAKILGKTAGPSGELACWTCHVVDDRG